MPCDHKVIVTPSANAVSANCIEHCAAPITKHFPECRNEYYKQETGNILIIEKG
jgi:hypothetical protein